jgi:hypothetical protein
VRAWFACANQSPSDSKRRQGEGRHSSIAMRPSASAITMKVEMPSRRVGSKIRIPSPTVRARSSARRCGHWGSSVPMRGSLTKKLNESAKPASFTPTVGRPTSGQPAAT